MPQQIVLMSRNHRPLTLRALFEAIFLPTFTLFFLFGNFFRLVPIAHFQSHLSVAEGALYALALPVYFLKLRWSQLLVMALCTSTLYGTILHGFEAKSVLYSLKLIGMIASGVVLGEILQRRDATRFWIRHFLILLILSTLLLFLFPEAPKLFQLLEGVGVRYFGDPHSRRFISLFFDPNYYAAIACIPLLLSLQQKRHGLALLFFLSILATWSRSGVATALFLLFLFALKESKRTSLLLLATLPLCLILPSESGVFFHRLLHLFDDPSALGRVTNLEGGLLLFLKRPLFGCGYNYLIATLDDHLFLYAMDSSLLITLINFGLLPTLAAITALLLHTKKSDSRTSRWLYIYLWICILFTSQFNNLLYYPYWLIPMIAMCKKTEKYENSSRP